MGNFDRIAAGLFFFYLVIVMALEPSIMGMVVAFGPLGVPLRLRGVCFEEAGDGGASGSGGAHTPESGKPDSVPSQEGNGSEPAGPKGIDAEIEEAMRMTDQVSDPDYEEDPEKGGSGDGGRETEDGHTPETSDEVSVPSQEGNETDDDVEYVEGFDPNDVVEVDGSAYFYHPKEHAPDVKHGNVYRSRDDAEMAWTHKVARIQELSEKLNELGKGVGPVDLPEWYDDPENPASLQAKGDIDEAIQLPNKELRERLAQGDNLITYLDDRVKRVDSEVKTAKMSEDLETRVDEIYNQVDPLIDELGLAEAVKTAQTSADLRKQAAAAVEKKISADLKDLEKEYNDYKSNADARMDDDDYPDKLERKRDAIREKRRELKQKYETQFLAPFDKMLEVEKEVAEFKEKQKEATGVSEKERLKVQNDAFMDFQAEMMEKHPIFQATDPKGVKAFRDWAVNRAEQFGGLKNSYQWGKAIKAFDVKIEERRAEVRRKKVEADNEKNRKPADKPNIPGYGDQKKLTDTGKNVNSKQAARERVNAEMEELMAETDASLKG